jgi:hypothetical protein
VSLCRVSLGRRERFNKTIDIEGAKIDCLSLFMCPLLAQLKIGFFSSFSDAAVYITNEANKAGLKQSIIFRCL